jgi:hypothetical protein
MTRRHTPERLTLDAILPHLRTKRVSKRNGERHVLAHCLAKLLYRSPPTKFGAMLGTFGAMSVPCRYHVGAISHIPPREAGKTYEGGGTTQS